MNNSIEEDKAAWQAAITAADTVWTNAAAASQVQIDEAAAALNTAINNLRAITTVHLDIDHTMIPKTKTAALSVTAKDQLGVTMGLEFCCN